MAKVNWKILVEKTMIPRYDCPEIKEIWSKSSKYEYWTRIELTFFRYFRGVKLNIPSYVRPGYIREIERIENSTKHDVAAFVQWLETYLHDEIGEESRFVHYGLTSSDIVDTAFSMAIKDSDRLININLSKLIAVLDGLIEKHKGTWMLGRTHGQAAEKISLANKFSSYKSILSYLAPKERYFGRLAGSVGDYKYFSKEVEERTLTELGLEVCPVNDGQVINRAVYARYMNSWALLASAIGKIATDIRLLAQSDVGEMQEGFSHDQIGSSSMPQKQNPILCENLCGLARVIRGYQTTSMQDIELWLERDISNSSAERIIYPDAAVLLGFMLARLNDIFSCLVINDKKMAEKLDEVKDKISAQEKMLGLIKNGVSRRDALNEIKKSLR